MFYTPFSSDATLRALCPRSGVGEGETLAADVKDQEVAFGVACSTDQIYTKGKSSW